MTDGRATDRRDQIVAAARRAFTSHGYDGTSIGGLAAELGISKAAIGYYFPAKEDFLDELVTPLLDALDDALAAAASDPGRALSGYLASLTAHHDVAVWLDTDPVLQHHPVHGKRLADINGRLLDLLGADDDPDRVRALTTLGGVWRPVRELPTATLEAHHDHIVAAALSG